MRSGLDPALVASVARDAAVRRRLTAESFAWFFAVYFAHYLTYETAPFQREIFELLEDGRPRTLVLCAFRGSGKSTIVTTAYALWSVLGRQGRRHVLIAGQTQRQARQHLRNIRQELEGNAVLRGDLGPFREEPEEWGALSLVVPSRGARITAVSAEQSVRGARHGAHRPDLIVADDVEDLASAQTLEGRDKTYEWFTGDLVPAGDVGTRTVVVGNLLHEDSLVMRLRRGIESGRVDGDFRRYPIIGEDGRPAWPGKYPDAAAIEAERRKTGDDRAWMREQMLTIVPDDGQVVRPEWVRRYDAAPGPQEPGYRFTVAAADLAISERQAADRTAIVVARVFGWGDDLRVYVLPHPVNARLDFPSQVAAVKRIVAAAGVPVAVLVEDVGYQRALVQTLVREGVAAEGVPTGGQDKRTRLALASTLIQSGAVLFPRTGAEHLIQQLVGFGSERHDDLADALSMLIGYARTSARGPRRLAFSLDVGGGGEGGRPFTAGLRDMRF